MHLWEQVCKRHFGELLAERYDVVTAPGQGTLVAFRPDGEPAETVVIYYDSYRNLLARRLTTLLTAFGSLATDKAPWTDSKDLPVIDTLELCYSSMQVMRV